MLASAPLPVPIGRGYEDAVERWQGSHHLAAPALLEAIDAVERVLLAAASSVASSSVSVIDFWAVASSYRPRASAMPQRSQVSAPRSLAQRMACHCSRCAARCSSPAALEPAARYVPWRPKASTAMRRLACHRAPRPGFAPRRRNRAAPVGSKRRLEAKALARVGGDEHLMQHVRVRVRRTDTDHHSVTFGAPNVGSVALRERRQQPLFRG